MAGKFAGLGPVAGQTVAAAMSEDCIEICWWRLPSWMSPLHRRRCRQRATEGWRQGAAVVATRHPSAAGWHLPFRRGGLGGFYFGALRHLLLPGPAGACGSRWSRTGLVVVDQFDIARFDRFCGNLGFWVCDGIW